MSGVPLTREEYEIHQRLFNDLEFFARHIARIEPKDLIETDADTIRIMRAILDADPEPTPGMLPLIFRPGQRKLHHAIEEQLERCGLVRKTIVKPRQVGWSTLIQTRGYWKATKTPMLKISIISHNDPSTARFLRRARLLCKTAPPSITPGRSIENSKILQFDNGATYSIATAGSPDAMRSDNSHFFHGSEVPYWPNQQDTIGAILPALSDGPGSEGYLESTSKGKGTPWHNWVQECRAGDSIWEVFFDAWFNNPKSRLTPPPGWEPNDEAKEAAALYGLDLAQLYWRHCKIKELRALWLFKQEFPATIDDSFQSSENTLYNPDVLYRAKKNTIEPSRYAPLILGVDAGRSGDRTVIAPRRGKVFLDQFKIHPKMDDMRLAGILATYLRDGFHGQYVSRVFLDYAIGEGAASRLRELGFGDRVTVVHFGESAIEPDRFMNKRVEMAVHMRDWFGDTGEHVSIPDDDDIVSDLLAIPDFLQSTGSEKIKLPPKAEIKKAYGKSPDIFDAMILTFAYPVPEEATAEKQAFIKEHMGHVKLSELGSIVGDFNAF